MKKDEEKSAPVAIAVTFLVGYPLLILIMAVLASYGPSYFYYGVVAQRVSAALPWGLRTPR